MEVQKRREGPFRRKPISGYYERHNNSPSQFIQLPTNTVINQKMLNKNNLLEEGKITNRAITETDVSVGGYDQCSLSYTQEKPIRQFNVSQPHIPLDLSQQLPKEDTCLLERDETCLIEDDSLDTMLMSPDKDKNKNSQSSLEKLVAITHKLPQTLTSTNHHTHEGPPHLKIEHQVSQFMFEHKMPPNGLRVTPIAVEHLVFQANYHQKYLAQQHLAIQLAVLKNQSKALLKRLKGYLKKNPLQCFSFYRQVMVAFQQVKLPLYLIERGLRYNSVELQSFQSLLTELLSACKPQQAVQWLFMEGQDDHITINFTGESFIGQLCINQDNFWKFMEPVIHNYKNQPIKSTSLKYQLSKLSQFLSKLL